jgi:hypothetical protein
VTTAPITPSSPVPSANPPLSQGARLVNVFIAPSKTFTDLRRSASWWAPWLVISVFSLLFIFAMGKQVGFEQISKNQVAHSSRAEQFDKLPPDQQEKRLQISAKFIEGFGYGSPIMLLLYALIAAAVIWVTFKVAAGAETTFAQAYAIIFYAWLPGAIGAILGTIALFAGVNPEGFDINNPVGTNLAYYLDPDTTGKFVRSMASAVDILTIWTIILIGIGFASTSKVKRGTAIAIVAVWFIVFKLVGAALASM